MSRAGASIAIAGGGIAGLAVAAALSERGARIRLFDPDGPPSASAVAAGMLAPALESLFDPLAADHFRLLDAAAQRWPAFLDRAGLGKAGLWRRAGALIAAQPGQEDELGRLAGRLGAIGARAEPVEGAALAGLCPGLSGDVSVLLVPGEAGVSPLGLMRSLRALLEARGVVLIARAWTDAERTPGEELVIAAGAGAAALSALAPELGVLQPIRGQVLAFSADPGLWGGPTLRGVTGAYLAPQPEGPVAGGTMEPGRLDLAPDAATMERQRAQAAALVPALASAAATARVGVRASTPDGLPLVGRSSSGVLLATGMRRNGWLLAPLAAEIIAAELFGEPAPPEAALFTPGRFKA